MSLSAYLSQAQYFCDELLKLLSVERVHEAGKLLDKLGYDVLVDIPPKEKQSLFVFLEKTASNRQKSFEKMSGNEQLLFWLRARYISFLTVDALSTAYTVNLAVGGAYRKSFRTTAQSIDLHPHLPSKDDLLWFEIR